MFETPRWLHEIVWAQHRARVAACIDHDLQGPRGKDHVFATCTKCEGRFKVLITETIHERPDPIRHSSDCWCGGSGIRDLGMGPVRCNMSSDG